ncbi:3638_t:CDS:2 [Diversispora eburnea]|uniref:3638_t:CDS:1 n=1 Tax=Diversispora eburnea TaxID=1213867 RepID=A0A9N8ZUX1_9GLOM|nr:3638_t:CDS:2 [Diversispora eburnea]
MRRILELETTGKLVIVGRELEVSVTTGELIVIDNVELITAAGVRELVMTAGELLSTSGSGIKRSLLGTIGTIGSN